MATNLHLRQVEGITVPSPGFGGMGLSNVYGKADDEESKKVLRHAIDIGATFWDTQVPVWDHFFKHSSVLKEGNNRSKVFLCTKFGNVFDRKTLLPTGEVRGDAAYVKECIEESISRLGCTPDLYYQHRVDPKVPIEETYTALEELRKAGKFKYIGISEPNAETLRKAAKVARISALQVEYSPWTTDIERNGVLATARELGIPVVAYSPLGRGFLTGRYKTLAELDPNDRRRAHPRFKEENWDNNYMIVEKLQGLAAKKGITPAQLALAWVAAQGDDIIPIPGTKSISRLDENWKSRDICFTPGELKAIREVIDSANIQGTRYPAEQMRAVEQ
ncbi:Aldo/keto reductase [Gautieria morchelliformis]|nr:Aldo/keto reductase [Gautieria morchelliformis]